MLRKIKNNMTRTQMIALGYFLLIALGTLLLMLPAASKTGEKTNVLTALFTATSATCVTGLVVVDTGTYWSVFGQCVILGLIQIGGLGFVTIGVLFATVLNRKITLRTRGLLQESMNVSQMGGVVRLAKLALRGTAVIELTGAFLLSLRFVPEFGVIKGIGFGIFHSISAFCNAGFDLMGADKGVYSSFTSYAGDALVNLVIMILIVVGGIGFLVWDDIFVHGRHFRKYALHTKLALSVTAVLIFGGAGLFFLFERGNLLAGSGLKESILASLFSSVTARTAGFNTIDTAGLTTSSKLLTMVLMFIGGSPGSTAGGIKTTTLIVLLIFVRANLRHSRGCNIFGRRLEEDAVKKASSVTMISMILIISTSIVICFFQTLPMEDVLFEVFSAIGTVGMSTGVTRELNSASRLVIVFLMYCGRIGSMAFALFFMEKRKTAPIQCPAEKVMIG
ncbi:MAG: TrkH family potassium uptake protein [Firmicutes bacterium]|nr:TrkH family potassium uptake protein [Lachnospiraceae bacterium]MDD6066616.1 TrkH family potassium uptake protein [Bacillota bacterium]MDY2820638.1 TrkH family potassium uptake protein [Hominisplanchenecus sp.]